MKTSTVYIFIALVVIALIAFAFFQATSTIKHKRLSLLASLSFAFIIAGFSFGENRYLGYGLLGTGALLAILDIIKNSRRK